MNLPEKIHSSHLERLAVVYVRQSTLQQVERHQESTRLQYGLAEQARRYGWSPERVLVIDDDLGCSGTTAEGRLGFQRLVTEVGLGHVGLVLGIEMSRLARSCRDWHQLLEICAVCDTLIADADGIYDPAHYNDRLLLGLKGTLSEAELHILQARMHEGKRAKAKRGELCLAVPRGYVCLPDGSVEFDPDEQVQAIVRLIFAVFERRGHMNAVLRYLVDHGLKLPTRHGTTGGALEWRRPNRQTLTNMLHNPIYAGAYAFGRGVDDQRPGSPRSPRRAKPDQWLVLIKDRLPAYISFVQYEANVAQMAANRSQHRGVPRGGPSLLAGMLTCGRCGHRMIATYCSNGHDLLYACIAEASVYGGERCQAFTGRALDAHVAGLILDALTPSALEVSLQLAEDIEIERAALHRQWAQRRERAVHAAERAERQYDAAEPENRLVVRTLEARWEEALRKKAALDEDYARFCAREPARLTRQEIAFIRRLASDVPALWQAETTTPQDRQAIARLVLDRVTVTMDGRTERLQVDCDWAGGARTRSWAIRPVATLAQLSSYPALVARLTALHGNGLTAGAIADILNAEDWHPAKRVDRFTRSMVAALLRRIGLVTRARRTFDAAAHCRAHEWPLRDLASELDMPEQTLHGWVNRGWIKARKIAVGAQAVWLLCADGAELEHLRELRRHNLALQQRRPVTLLPIP
jgi:DNA invertase Pin-like site-specific DNA recombinase